MNSTFPSVNENNYDVKILKEIKYKKFGYIYRTEQIKMDKNDTPTTMIECYDFNGLYLGNNKTANFLCRKRKLTNFESSETSNIARIGYNEEEHKWYGWSHRAIYGFSIGSIVKRGDCAYIPANKEEMLEDLIEFWDLGKVIDCGKRRQCAKRIISVDFGYEHRAQFYKVSPIESNNPNGELTCDESDVEYGEPQIGIRIKYKTSFNHDRKPYESEVFEAYPSKWVGEWSAKTMADVKQMAVDFAESVG